MPVFDTAAPIPPRTGWASLRELKWSHWFVFAVCCAAWDLDCLDQQLFVLARDPAIADLTHLPGNDVRAPCREAPS